MNDRASPAFGAEDPGVNHSDGALDIHSIPPWAYYSKPSDRCVDPTSSHVQKHSVSASQMPQSPGQGSPGGLTRWGALGSALRSLEDEAKRTG